MGKAARLHGASLLLVDVINGFAFEGARALVRAAERAAPRISRLADRARESGVPVIYINDNFGRWRSDFNATVHACTQPDQPGRRVSSLLRPREGDYFVLKPQHSGFYFTPLELLLDHLGVHTVVLAGFAANYCVLFTADDAHMRSLRVMVPADCTAANSPSLTRAALRHVEAALHGDVQPSTRVDFAALARLRPLKRAASF
jgi:nicotinamidase-related amidase